MSVTADNREIINDFNERLILEVNDQLIKTVHSHEYLIGKNLEETLSYIRKGRIHDLLRKLRIRLFHPELERGSRSDTLSSYLADQCSDSETIDHGHMTVTVYSCVTGSYDSEMRRPFYSDNTSYILFTDDFGIRADGWELRKIPSNLLYMKPQQINRYIKMHPYEFFNSDFSVYIDGNIWLLSDIWPMCVKALNAKISVAMFGHGSRDCVYEEAQACKLLKRGNTKGINKQIAECKKNGIGPHSGLLEACVIATYLKDASVKAFYDSWWNELCLFGSERDQLALPSAVQKLGYTMHDFGILGENARTDSRLYFFLHSK